MTPGSLTWLILHELRIEWRELRSQWNPALAIGIGAAVILFLTFIWYQLLGTFGSFLQAPLAPEANILAGVLVLGILPVTVMLGINQSIKAVFERNDLDLLLSSPLPTRTVFASRLLGVSAYIFVLLGVFILPLVIAALIQGIPMLLGAVPLLLALALTGAAIGMLLTLLLVRLLGARQARLIGQLLGAVSGAFVILALQIPALLGGSEVSNETIARVVTLFQPGGILASDSPLWLPGRALFLEPLPSMAVVVTGVALLFLAVITLHRWFLLGVGSSLTVSGRRRRTAGRTFRFSLSGSLWRTMLRKEWRLLIRDPYLLGQTLLQLLYMLPLAFVLFFDGDVGLTVAIGPLVAVALTVLSGSLGASLCRIVLAGEEAMDLLVASPVAAMQIRRAKFVAALLPVWALTVPLVIGLMLFEPVAGLTALVGITLASFSTAFVRFRNPGRAQRQDLFKRAGQGDQVLQFIDGLIPLAWAGTVWLLLVSSWWAVATSAFALVLLVIVWQRGAALGFEYAEISP